MIKNATELKETIDNIKRSNSQKPPINILVSMGTCGIAAGTTPVLKKIKEEMNSYESIKAQYEIVETGCMGLCHSEPTIELIERSTGKSIIYGNVAEKNIPGILRGGIKKTDEADILEKTWYYPEEEKNTKNVLQARIALKNTGRINPEKIEDYLNNDGYLALAKCLTDLTTDQVIKEVSESGLRGRGGGGFPTGTKWSFAAAQKSKIKYIICNADEGDPGAFMDRAVLEGDPHSVIEAMTLAGYAISATKGFIYIRAEYPLAIKRLQIAIEQAKEHGLLGENILGSKFNFNIEIRYGAGAFVCGEETALIRSIEGQRGMPTFKPPFPAISGLWKKPTIVNNVETFANLPTIIRNGAAWFRKIGTENSPGTKVFALAGKIDKVGLIEVPMGTPLREIIFNIGGGIMDNKEFKAVQTGGPSGGCIVPKYLDTPIDYDTLKELGSMMGSGGMIVLDEDDCMVDIAKFFLDFTVDESCGKCTPCRVGGRQMFNILDKITEGKGTEEDLVTLEKLSDTIKTASLCGLGMTAPNPVLSTMKYFESEYKQHVFDKKCIAKKCAKLLSYIIISDKCKGCTLCIRACPADCITGAPKKVHVIDQSKCIKCGACFNVCKFKAIEKE